jgi:hypothetical protein
MVYGTPSPTSTVVTGSFTVPANATLGSARLRIIMSYGATVPAVCGTFEGGEVEDYCVSILEPGSTNAIVNYQDYLNVYPNPTAEQLFFASSNTEMKTVQLLSFTGQVIQELSIENGMCRADVSQLADGIYLYRILNENRSVLLTNKFIVQKYVYHKKRL